jgi:hypothetical protein
VPVFLHQAVAPDRVEVSESGFHFSLLLMTSKKTCLQPFFFRDRTLFAPQRARRQIEQGIGPCREKRQCARGGKHHPRSEPRLVVAGFQQKRGVAGFSRCGVAFQRHAMVCLFQRGDTAPGKQRLFIEKEGDR